MKPAVNRVHIVGWYFACSDGTVYSEWGQGRVLKMGRGTNGRPLVNIVIEGRTHTKYVHVLICEAFHGPRPANATVSHIDGDMWNNRPENLVWETQAENNARKFAHGTHDRGHNNSRSVLTPSDVVFIHEMKRDGWADQRIADHLGVSRTTVVRVKKGQRYGTA